MSCYTCRQCPENLSGCSFDKCEECSKILCKKDGEVFWHTDDIGNTHILCEDCANDYENETETKN